MTTELKEKFATYHQDNPHIYSAFESITRQTAMHRVKFGAKAIMEIIRWNTMLNGGDDFKINNNYTAYYARLFEENNPRLVGIFRKRSINKGE